MNSPVVLTGNSFLRFFILLVFFFLCEFGEAKLYFCKSVSMQEYPFVSFLGVTLYYWCGGLDLCCLFLLHEKSVIPMMLSMFSGRRGQ